MTSGCDIFRGKVCRDVASPPYAGHSLSLVFGDLRPPGAALGRVPRDQRAMTRKTTSCISLYPREVRRPDTRSAFLYQREIRLFGGFFDVLRGARRGPARRGDRRRRRGDRGRGRGNGWRGRQGRRRGWLGGCLRRGRGGRSRRAGACGIFRGARSRLPIRRATRRQARRRARRHSRQPKRCFRL